MVKTVNVKNIKELKEISNCYNTNSAIFRGQHEVSWPIYPSIYRKQLKGIDFTQEKLLYLESIGSLLHTPILTNFKIILKYELSNNEMNNTTGNRYHDLLLWAYIQHYGFGTPYIDWTCSLPIALIFSLFKNIREIKIPNKNEKILSNDNHIIALYVLKGEIDFRLFYFYDFKNLKLSNERMITQEGCLLMSKTHYFLENSILNKNIIKYEIPGLLVIDFLCENLLEDKTLENKLSCMIKNLRDYDKFQKETDCILFLKKIKDIVENTEEKNLIDQKIREIGFTKNIKGFNEDNFIAVGLFDS